jgi:hypothetical protein
MRHILRLLVFGCAATASLALAGNAFAKTPQLIVSGATTTGASAATTVEVKEEKADAAPLKITIYVPTGYVANLGQSISTQIGTVDASLQALVISPDAIITATGTVTVGDATSTPLRTSAAQCTGVATHAAIWLLNVTVAGQALVVPVYVDPTTGTEAAFSSAKLVLCLPNPYAEAQPPSSRAASGAKIIDAKLILSAGVLTNPSPPGSYVWRTVITPWTVNGATPNVVGTIETQAIVTIPASVSLKAKVKTVRHKKNGKTTVTNSVLLSGKLLENLTGVSGGKVAFFANGKTAGSTRTKAGGSFSKQRGLTKRTRFSVKVAVPTRETSCTSPLPATSVPGGCVSATMAGYTLTSSTVLATPKKR